MSVTNAIIRISNLRLRTYIGFNPEERTKQQDVVINVEIHHRAAAPALERDEVGAALDYKVISKAIIAHVEEGSFLLLEKLVHDLLGICTAHHSVSKASVTVDKPHALRFADSVSLTLEWQASTQSNLKEVTYAGDNRTLSQAS